MPGTTPATSDALAPSEAGRRVSRARETGLFLVSASLLTLELVQTRIFAYCLDSILLYTAVAIALLGLGISGTAMALWPALRRTQVSSLAAGSAAAFGVSVILTHALFARLSPGLRFGMNGLLATVLAMMAVPYFFAGVAVTACLAAAGRGVFRAYFVNLIGSAVGCFVLVGALKPLGAPALLIGVALLATAAGASFLVGGGSRLARLAVVVGGLVAAAPLLSPDRVFPFAPDPRAHLSLLSVIAQAAGIEATPERLYGAWDPAGRIEVHRFANTTGELQARLPDPVAVLLYSQDGGAGSVLIDGSDPDRAMGLYERTLYGGAAAYQLRGPRRTHNVLVIGLGGGPDVVAALRFGAGSITGVEINGSAIEAVEGPFAKFTGDPYRRPGVQIVHMDGRSFVRSANEQYDLILLSGVDTKAAGQGAGSLAISESHLYTVEAFEDYLDHLAPGGHLAVLRFLSRDRLRLAALGVAALRRHGIADPAHHFVALEQGRWTVLIVGREPIDDDAHQRLRAWIAGVPRPDTGIRMPYYDLVGFSLAMPPRIVYPTDDGSQSQDVGGYLAAVSNGRDAELIEATPWAMAPPVDDRPFFFDHQRRDRLLTAPAAHYQRLGGVLLALTLLAALAIAAPIPVFRRGIDHGRGLLRTVTYFLCLGIGFMLVELSLTQKLVLFLGHQTYALSVVLATLLVSAGLGSLVAARLQENGGAAMRRRIVPALVLLVALLVLTLDPVARAAAGSPLAVRMALAALMLFPLGFVLGMPFPTGLAALTGAAASRVPWAIGANGFGSVFGAAVALPAAMLCGYRILILGSLALYVVAAAVFPKPPAAYDRMPRTRSSTKVEIPRPEIESTAAQ